jgi:hypothetical protein
MSTENGKSLCKANHFWADISRAGIIIYSGLALTQVRIRIVA